MEKLFMRFPGGKLKALTLSYDDGVEQDEKLIDIMKRYGLKGTFNISSGLFNEEGHIYKANQLHRRMTQKQCEQLYVNSGMEIASHALTHPFLEELPQNVIVKEIYEDCCNLEDLTGGFVRGFVYPYGNFGDKTVGVLREMGICYARTTISSHGFKMPTDWLRLKPTCAHVEPELEKLTEEFINIVDNGCICPRLFFLWGHAYEFERDDNWDVIEKFAEKVGGREDIWYATNIEIYDYQKAYNELIFDCGATKCYNPTAISVWISVDGKIHEVPAGQVIKL